MKTKIEIGIIGATSYTGRELFTILLRHSKTKVVWLTSESQQNEHYCRIYPRFYGKISKQVNVLRSLKDVTDTQPDIVFSCLPHGASAKFLQKFISNGKTKVIDLSADFRLKSLKTYEKYYSVKHPLPKTLKLSQYGLPEIYEDKIKKATVIGNPGCYPTSLLLPMYPLLEAQLIKPLKIIIDSKSGVSGAGKKPSEVTHFVNCNESIAAYKIGDQHRHLSEILEQMNLAAPSNVDILFTPHLIPMERGILSTIYCDMEAGVYEKDIRACLSKQYEKSAFTHIVDSPPNTGDVRNTNNCHIYIHAQEKSGTLILISVIDNLVKGASGQAVQNMNIMCGFPQTTGLV